METPETRVIATLSIDNIKLRDEIEKLKQKTEELTKQLAECKNSADIRDDRDNRDDRDDRDDHHRRRRHRDDRDDHHRRRHRDDRDDRRHRDDHKDINIKDNVDIVDINIKDIKDINIKDKNVPRKVICTFSKCGFYNLDAVGALEFIKKLVNATIMDEINKNTICYHCRHILTILSKVKCAYAPHCNFCAGSYGIVMNEFYRFCRPEKYAFVPTIADIDFWEPIEMTIVNDYVFKFHEAIPASAPWYSNPIYMSYIRVVKKY